MSKNFLFFFLIISICLFSFQNVVAQNATNPAVNYDQAKGFCEVTTNREAGQSVQQCIRSMTGQNRSDSNSDSSGGNCSSFRTEINNAKKELCRACTGLGVPGSCNGRSGDTAQIVIACQKAKGDIGKCRRDFDQNASKSRTNSTSMAGVNVSGIFTTVQDSIGKCGFLKGQNLSEIKEDISDYQDEFRDNDQKRQDAEKEYFDTEANMLEKANEIQEKVIEAQKNAGLAQKNLTRVIREIFGTKDTEANNLIRQLESLNASEESLGSDGARLIQDEFESAKNLLELSCMDKARRAVADRKMQKAQKKGSNQWKFDGLTEVINGGVGYRANLNKFGMEIYVGCKNGDDKDFVEQFQKAARELKEKSLKRDNDLKEIRVAKARIQEELEKLDARAKDKQKDAIEDAETEWQDAQNKVIFLQSEFNRSLTAAATKQQKNAADISLYRGLAETAKKNLDASRAAKEMAKGHKESEADDIKSKESDAAASLTELEGLEENAYRSCCNKEGKSTAGESWDTDCERRKKQYGGASGNGVE